MSSPSPICQVKDAAGAYQPPPLDATPGDTVTINLVSSAGVGPWSIACVYTDELSVAATVNASLVIDSVAKTATFTAPVAGRAYIFQSQVNGGKDVNGVARPSYTTTFGVFTLTIGSRRVHAVNETFESDATFGWCTSINDLIRNPVFTAPTGNGFVTVNGGSLSAASTSNIRYTGGKFQTDANLQWTNGANLGDLAWVPTAARTLTLPDATDTIVGRGTTDTLTNKTLTSPLLTSPTLTTPAIKDGSGSFAYNFAVSNLATSRTVTLPLLSGNDTFVFQSFTQTLSNKTLDATCNVSAATGAGGGFQEVAVAGNVTLSAVQEIVHVDTSAGRTLTLPAPFATACYIIKDISGTSETNNITLAQHVAEKIEGRAASMTLQKNWGSWVVTSNGTDWFVAPLARGVIAVALTGASGTFTPPSGVTSVDLIGWGGGGGGGGGARPAAANATSAGGIGGGGGGAALMTHVRGVAVTPGTGVSWTNGTAGSAGATATSDNTSGGNGGNGGDGTFGALATFVGGAGGLGGGPAGNASATTFQTGCGGPPSRFAGGSGATPFPVGNNTGTSAINTGILMGWGGQGGNGTSQQAGFSGSSAPTGAAGGAGASAGGTSTGKSGGGGGGGANGGDGSSAGAAGGTGGNGTATTGTAGTTGSSAAANSGNGGGGGGAGGNGSTASGNGAAGGAGGTGKIIVVYVP